MEFADGIIVGSVFVFCFVVFFPPPFPPGGGLSRSRAHNDAVRGGERGPALCPDNRVPDTTTIGRRTTRIKGTVRASRLSRSHGRSRNARVIHHNNRDRSGDVS